MCAKIENNKVKSVNQCIFANKRQLTCMLLQFDWPKVERKQPIGKTPKNERHINKEIRRFVNVLFLTFKFKINSDFRKGFAIARMQTNKKKK